ncbi:MAG: HIT domain-containing protein [Nanoarchaeota archaeon]|nr:HIT domain-containing protein [Nanoarchaeota archaeon]
MPLTPTQIEELKKQLSEQIQHLPLEQRQQAEKQIDSMSAEALELMLKQQQKQMQNAKVFRLIIKGNIPSKKIDENNDAIAVLDIRPISKGHTIIIPKKPAKNTNQIPEQAFTLAKQISKKIISKLKAKNTEIQTESKFNEVIINIIPVYDEPLNINSPRHEANEQELKEVLQKLKEEKKLEIIKIKKNKTEKSKIIKLKRKIP